MAIETWLNKVEELAQQISEREGCLLYDLDFMGTGSGRTLRVFIDKAEGVVSIDDCSRVSQALNLQLDVDDVVPGGAYNLEVSSPGLERRLKKKWHFEKAIGKKIDLKLEIALGELGWENLKNKSIKRLKPVVKEVKEDQVLVEWEGLQGGVPFSSIEKANVCFEIVKGKKK
ncbi:MAG TPA: ribosome maturation factor RimP [Pseudobdellovibrionaceae bacterium]|nr:ribosome maturation factor RimP [Pseudobdellovibrionaceae bacterium]